LFQDSVLKGGNMMGRFYPCKSLGFILLSLVSVTCQERQPTVTIVFAVLQRTLDTKTAAVGDEVTLITLNDVVTNNRIVIPKGSKVSAHVAGAISRGKNEPKSLLAIALDRATGVSGQRIPLQAIIAAIAAPPGELTADPTYAMMHSNEPKMVSSANATSSSGTLPPSSKADSNAAVATAELKGQTDQPLLLKGDSQGAIGYEDITITWQLALPPPLTVFTTKAKSLKLTNGTQMLLRMAEPRVPE
jgi:hypothetical protein